ncbi:hypothetical protein, variant [Saprolegnia diclina VS20]|uniref:Phosphodiesterase n=1 Tax=Saprolegnia diclina (strain VS20) TaxID=1156394 RepID=T0S3D9_SAPDV|nr:hypothetical protein, variant [Saprolegnia diclina VS20]EQC39543.1 hypothetical protein, variant [Saprolegnia diclina VS20]|eukprot:XP_008606815.1 hypothetical protein, variant [Saprolegnia diclina VS20]
MRPRKGGGSEFRSIVVAAPRAKASLPRPPHTDATKKPPARSPSPTRHSSLNVEQVLEKQLLSSAPPVASATIDETFRRLHFYRYLASLRLDDASLQDTARVTMMLQETLYEAFGVLGADCLVVYMVTDMYLHVRATTSRDLLETNHSLVQSLPGELLLQRGAPDDPSPVFVLNVQRHAAYNVASDVDGRLGTRTHSYLAYPILVRGVLAAVVELRCYKEHYFCPVLLPPFIGAIGNLLQGRRKDACASPTLRPNALHITKLVQAPPPNANAALAQALRGVVQLVGAETAWVFQITTASERILQTAASSGATEVRLFPQPKGPNFAQLTLLLSRVGPVAAHSDLALVQTLVGDAVAVVSAAVVAIPSVTADYYSVLCVSTSAPSLACEPNVFKLVRAIMVSGCEIDKLTSDVGFLSHQKQLLIKFLELTNDVWMTSDGGRKMQLICAAGTAFFATKDFRLYVCDRVHQELWSFNGSGISSGKHVPFGDGVVGAIVETKATRWYLDVRVDEMGAVTEYAPGTGSHACLVVPICNSRGDVVAVSQALHKTSATTLHADLRHVQAYDTLFLLVFASAMGHIIEKNPALLMFAKVHADRERVSRLHHEHAMAKQHERIRSLLQASGLETLTSNEFATFHAVKSAASKLARTKLKGSVSMAELGPHADRFLTPSPALLQIDINVFEKTFLELKALVVAMFSSYRLLDTFRIDVAGFKTFLDALQLGYRELPYHSFYHAFSVTHLTYFLLAADRLPDVNELDALGVLLAALGHDLGHPGNDNAFEVATSSELAIRYNDISVLESHSIALLFGLLRDPCCNVLGSLDASQYATLRQCIIQCILHTDIKYHAELVSAMTEKADPKLLRASSNGKQLYLNWILHTSDLGNSTLSPSTSLLWMERVCAEFADQAQRMHDLGLPAPPHYAHMENPQMRDVLQVNFLDFVVLPLWTLTSQLVPHAKPLLDQIQANRDYFAARSRDEVSDKPLTKRHG